MTKEYVVGFYFTDEGNNILLIKKARPEWQRGQLNGIGGSVEPGESPLEAMRREFLEEAGASVTDWRYIITLNSDEKPHETKGPCPFTLHIFATHGPVISHRHWKTDEGEVGWYRLWHDVPFGPFECVWNLKWLIPLSYELLHQPHWFLSQELWEALAVECDSCGAKPYWPCKAGCICLDP